MGKTQFRMVSMLSDSHLDDSSNRTLMDPTKFSSNHHKAKSQHHQFSNKAPAMSENNRKLSTHIFFPNSTIPPKVNISDSPHFARNAVTNQLTYAPISPKVTRHHKEDYDLLKGVNGSRDGALMSPYVICCFRYIVVEVVC